MTAETPAPAPARKPWIIRTPAEYLDARTNPLRPCHSRLLQVLDRYCGRKAYCWTSNDELAAAYGCGPRNLQLRLAELEAAGHVKRLLRVDGRPGRVGIILRRRADPSLPVADTDDLVAQAAEALARKRPGGPPRQAREGAKKCALTTPARAQKSAPMRAQKSAPMRAQKSAPRSKKSWSKEEESENERPPATAGDAEITRRPRPEAPPPDADPTIDPAPRPETPPQAADADPEVVEEMPDGGAPPTPEQTAPAPAPEAPPEPPAAEESPAALWRRIRAQAEASDAADRSSSPAARPAAADRRRRPALEASPEPAPDRQTPSQRRFLDGLAPNQRARWEAWSPAKRAQVLAAMAVEVDQIVLREILPQLDAAPAPEPPPPDTPTPQLIRALQGPPAVALAIAPSLPARIMNDLEDGGQGKSWGAIDKLCREVVAGIRDPESLAVPLEKTLAARARGEPIANLGAYWTRGVQNWDREAACPGVPGRKQRPPGHSPKSPRGPLRIERSV